MDRTIFLERRVMKTTGAEWLWVLILFLFSIGLHFSCEAQPVETRQSDVNRTDIEKIMRKVADWQLAHPNKTPMGDWVQGPFINGLFALGLIPDNEHYLTAVEQIGSNLNWQVIKTVYIANDHCTPQTWLDFYKLKKVPAMIEPTRKSLDKYIADTADADEDVSFTNKNFNKWSWCDALYMSPPAFARMGNITGEQKYYDYLNKWWWLVSKAYYDENEHLFFRDQKYVNNHSETKVFWSRGNGWVVGGLVRVLEDFPQNDPMRPRYENQLRQMCNRLLELQQPDGLWTPNLLDSKKADEPESSGSGFFIYALAYALNEKIIDQKYKPAICKAWLALAGLVKDNGQLTYVQPIAESPYSFDPNSTMPYGVGAFLLAGSEMWRLAK